MQQVSNMFIYNFNKQWLKTSKNCSYIENMCWLPGPGCPFFPKIMCLPNVIFHKVPLFAKIQEFPRSIFGKWLQSMI